MGGFGNTLANFGLTAQGMDTSQQVRQNYDMGTEQLAGAKQNNELRSQQVQAGRMGLEDATRARTDAANLRSAGQRGAQMGGVSGSLDEMALAAEQAGDVNKALQFRQLKTQLKQSGVVDAIHAVSMDDKPGPRPDVEQALTQSGNRNFTPGTVAFDGRGTISFTGKDGQPGTINVPVVAERLGLVPAPKSTVVPAGSTMVTTQPGRPTTTFTAPEKQQAFAPNANIEKVKVKDGDNEREYLWDVTAKRWLNGEPPAGTPAPDGGTSMRKDLPVIKEIGDEVMKREGMASSAADPSNPMGPQVKTLTKKGEQTAIIASQLWQSNKGMDPNTVINLASKGELVQNEAGELGWKSGGQVYKLNAPRGTRASAAPATPPAPKARDQNDLAREAEAKAKAKPAPASKATQAAADTTTDDIPEVATPAAEKQTPAQKREAYTERRKGEKDAASKERILKTFRDLTKLPRMSATDIPVIEDALKTGLLNEQETDKANRMLARLKPQTANAR